LLGRQLAGGGCQPDPVRPPGSGKSHLAAAIGLSLIENGWRVLFTRTSDLVQKLQVARRELALEAAIARLDKYHLLILDDLAYVTKDQAEASVLFGLISAVRAPVHPHHGQSALRRMEPGLPRPGYDPGRVDRLVHHATTFELNVKSYRRRAAAQRRSEPGRPPTYSTTKAHEEATAGDNQTAAR
jgi:DNA replication protein DnaC